ncbi:substrate-binding periplasmic protein, partial [Oceanicola sp. S124]|uniref:substrate-binding periplasmic protein n=1 Tax=Oceanicola sp. S124 TaxID=1042378 RepID=UPI0014390BE5
MTGLNFRLRLVLTTLVALALLTPSEVPAQERAEELVVPWSPVTGLYELRDDGELTGYFAELARAVAAQAGLSLRFERKEGISGYFAALASGEADMLAGVVELPALGADVVYSDPVATQGTYLFLPAGAPLDLTPDTISGMRIGTIGQAAGAETASFGGRNEVLAYPGPLALFGALLLGEVDAAVALQKAGLDSLQAARLDHLVRLATPPLQVLTHHVALHRSRADLMPRINEAIAALEASGKMEALRLQWNMTRPDPVPEVLTVGITHFPPYQV